MTFDAASFYNRVDKQMFTMLHAVERCFDDLRQADGSVGNLRVEQTCEIILDLYMSGSEDVRFKIVSSGSRVMPGLERRRIIVHALAADESALVRHEAAFSLSEFNDPDAETILSTVGLNDESFLVRHEAAIALMSVGTERSLPALEAGLDDSSIEVAVSCKLAISSILYRANGNKPLFGNNSSNYVIT